MSCQNFRKRTTNRERIILNPLTHWVSCMDVPCVQVCSWLRYPASHDQWWRMPRPSRLRYTCRRRYQVYVTCWYYIQVRPGRFGREQNKYRNKIQLHISLATQPSKEILLTLNKIVAQVYKVVAMMELHFFFNLNCYWDIPCFKPSFSPSWVKASQLSLSTRRLCSSWAHVWCRLQEIPCWTVTHCGPTCKTWKQRTWENGQKEEEEKGQAKRKQEGNWKSDGGNWNMTGYTAPKEMHKAVLKSAFCSHTSPHAHTINLLVLLLLLWSLNINERRNYMQYFHLHMPLFHWPLYI